MVKRLGSDYDSSEHISFIIVNSLCCPKDFRASWPNFLYNFIIYIVTPNDTGDTIVTPNDTGDTIVTLVTPLTN